MSKKSLKGFAKTRHFIQRQKERRISDKDVIRAMYEGELIETDHGQNFILGDLKITVDHALEVLITVLPKDQKMKFSKLLSKEDALKIREMLKKNEAAPVEEDEFLKYVNENKVKLIKK